MSEPESEVLLKLDHVTTYYAQMRILEGILLQVAAGELDPYAAADQLLRAAGG